MPTTTMGGTRGDGDAKRVRRRSPEIERAVGERLREIRLGRRMSSASLADKLGITFQQVQKYETGNDRVAVSTLVRIAEATGVPASAFVDGLGTAGAASRAVDVGDALTLWDRISGLDPEVRRGLLAFVEAVAPSPQSASVGETGPEGRGTATRRAAGGRARRASNGSDMTS